MRTQGWATSRGSHSLAILFCILLALSPRGWSSVLVEWTNPALPAARELGFGDLVVPWNGANSPLIASALTQGYRVYLEVPLERASAAAREASRRRLQGVILNIQPSQREELEKALPRLRSANPKLRVLVLDGNGKQPEMRGSLVIKRDTVLEVSSPTAQPWIDTNLALIRIEERLHPAERPLYTFAWTPSESGQQERRATVADYSLAIAEAGAFHADLILKVDEHLQKSLSEHDAEAGKLWGEVLSCAKFYMGKTARPLQAAANVAVVADDLDPGDEVMNLLARHNIPFKVLVPADLKESKLEGIDVVAVFAKPDKDAAERLTTFATGGRTVVVVDAHGSYPWQKSPAVPRNEHTVAYAVGSGTVLELGEPVSDPETFAQDIRRLLGKQNPLLTLWNGLTVIAVPYGEHDGSVKLVEFVNYAGEPVRVQVQVRGSWSTIGYESPEHGCCQTLKREERNGFTEFVIPDLRIAGRVHLETEQPATSKDNRVQPR